MFDRKLTRKMTLQKTLVLRYTVWARETLAVSFVSCPEALILII